MGPRNIVSSDATTLGKINFAKTCKNLGPKEYGYQIVVTSGDEKAEVYYIDFFFK